MVNSLYQKRGGHCFFIFKSGVIPENTRFLIKNGVSDLTLPGIIGGIKYEKIYEEIKCLEPEDTLQLTLEADSEEQREFYQMVGDFLLQKKQKQVIARNLF